MARYDYTGRLTNAQRLVFNASRNAQLYVQPKQPGVGPIGLITDQRIPVAVDPDTGAFTMQLEATASVVPPMLYQIVCEWMQDGQNHWSVWAEFRALVGGGAIADMHYGNLLGPALAWGFGPPEEHGVTNAAYIDVSGAKPVLYLPEGSRV